VCSERYKVCKEILVVSASNAIVDPWAMMVKGLQYKKNNCKILFNFKILQKEISIENLT